MTRRRVRSMRPLTPISEPRSTAPMIVSVTPFGMVGALARFIAPGFGQRPAAALAGEAKASAAARTAELVIMVFIMVTVLFVERNRAAAKPVVLDAGSF